MYNSIVHDHLCDTRLPTFETLSFFANGRSHSLIPQTLLSHAGLPIFETLSLNPNTVPVPACYSLIILKLSGTRDSTQNNNIILLKANLIWKLKLEGNISIHNVLILPFLSPPTQTKTATISDSRKILKIPQFKYSPVYKPRTSRAQLSKDSFFVLWTFLPECDSFQYMAITTNQFALVLHRITILPQQKQVTWAMMPEKKKINTRGKKTYFQYGR